MPKARKPRKPPKGTFGFTAIVPDLDSYIGKKVTIGGEEILIQSIKGNLTEVAFYEINGKYLINMLRFHAQMCGDTSITEEQFEEFEQIRMEIIKNKSTEGICEEDKRH